MSFNKRFTLTLATLVGLSAFTATAATTETRASFTLPSAAYWNDTLLPAGEYTLSVGRNLNGVPVFNLRGEGVIATFFGPAVAADVNGPSQLKLDGIEGTYVVREFDSGSVGQSFRFGVSKTVRNLLSKSEARHVTVPVSGM
ncbi:MAG: hypothetical protein ACLP59_24315 [Bryobacteraceae bacterium]